MPDQPEAEKVPLFPAADYGNPDPEPEWLRIDWREHLRGALEDRP